MNNASLLLLFLLLLAGFVGLLFIHSSNEFIQSQYSAETLPHKTVFDETQITAQEVSS